VVQELQGPQELDQTEEKQPQGKVDTPLCQGRNLISLSEIMTDSPFWDTVANNSMNICYCDVNSSFIEGFGFKGVAGGSLW